VTRFRGVWAGFGVITVRFSLSLSFVSASRQLFVGLGSALDPVRMQQMGLLPAFDKLKQAIFASPERRTDGVSSRSHRGGEESSRKWRCRRHL